MDNPHLKDPEIKNRKKISELLSAEEFEQLKDKFLIFDPDFDRAKLFTGIVTAALFGFEEDRSILAVNCKEGWFTHKLTNEEFCQDMRNCWLVCGNSPEESFIPYV